MVTMTSSSALPPAGMEHKSAPTMLAPRPGPSAAKVGSAALSGVTEVDGAGQIVALVAVTGVVDDVDDVIEPGAFRRSLRERQVKGVLGHDWLRVVAVAEEAVELMPGDPRLPRTAPDGTPWPPAAGALRVKARYLLGTKDGREAYEVSKAFGPEQGFSIGFRVRHARKVGRVRHIDSVDLYEFSPVLHGCNRLARLVSVKGGPQPRLETKSTADVVAQRRRAGGPVASACSMCGRPAAAVVPGGLRAGESLICGKCVEVAGEAAEGATATITPEDLAELDHVGPELTSEAEYAEALAAEQRWQLTADGEITEEAADDPARGRAWTSRARGAAWGRP